MALHDKSREELWEIGKKLGLSLMKNIDTEDLRAKVERAAIERHERITEEVREGLKAKAEIKRRVTELKVSADLAKIPITIPEESTIADVVRLEKEFGIKKKVPKPSPETLAIEASKKVYALFRNLEERDVDVIALVGGKHRFHFWHAKVHVVPEWLIQHYRSRANPAGTRPHSEYRDVHGHDKIAAAMSPTKREARFIFETLGDAPPDAKFGVVTDEAVLSKLEQTV